MGPPRPASLVHGDLNGKNLIVDPNTGRLRAVLDWEFSHGGEWTEDVGNLLRAADHGAGSGEVGAASWSAFRRGLVDALHTGIYEDGTVSTRQPWADWTTTGCSGPPTWTCSRCSSWPRGPSGERPHRPRHGRPDGAALPGVGARTALSGRPLRHGPR